MSVCAISSSRRAPQRDWRHQRLSELVGPDRAAEEEAAFLRQLFTGELRQGALAGVMGDAIAEAAGVPGEIARRALMLSGDLTRMAHVAMTEGKEGLRAVGHALGDEQVHASRDGADLRWTRAAYGVRLGSTSVRRQGRLGACAWAYAEFGCYGPAGERRRSR